jgi:MazG family protein
MSQPSSVPASSNAQAMDRLIGLMARLRAPDGCPWDREQTPATLKPQLLEECYEVLEAIDSGSPGHLTEELGDLLLHIVFQAQIAREAGDFTFADVANGIVDKMIQRHPHVFGEQKVADAAGVVTLWHQLKKAEKPERKSALDGVPRVLPALMRAEALQKKARNVGFDWPDPQGSLAKVREELAEVTAEIEGELAFAAANETKYVADEKAAEELGDLLFSIVNLTRHLKLDAEGLLAAANDKFSRRFRAVEEKIKASGKALADCTLEELDEAWNAVKSDALNPSP